MSLLGLEPTATIGGIHLDLVFLASFCDVSGLLPDTATVPFVLTFEADVLVCSTASALEADADDVIGALRFLLGLGSAVSVCSSEFVPDFNAAVLATAPVTVAAMLLTVGFAGSILSNPFCSSFLTEARYLSRFGSLMLDLDGVASRSTSSSVEV